MNDDKNRCPHCRNGQVYVPNQILPVDCGECNGTGLRSHPLWRAIGCVCYLAMIAFALWVAYSVIVFEYD